MKLLCSNVVRPSGCPFIFSVHAIFDDPVHMIWWQLQEIDVIAHFMFLVHLNMGSIMLLVVTLSVRLSGYTNSK